MNKKCLFAITNALLVGIIGLLVGLFCDGIFATSVGIAAFVCLLVSLLIPSAAYFFAIKGGTPAIVMTILLALIIITWIIQLTYVEDALNPVVPVME